MDESIKEVKKITLDIPYEMYKKLRFGSAEFDTSLSGYIRMLLSDALGMNEGTKNKEKEE